jgi:UbiD family decarboxylase
MVTANIDNQSLRGFLRMVETDFPDEFLRVQQPVDPKFESTAMVFELDRAGRSPVLMFENINGGAMPMVTNIAGNRKLLAACLGVTPEKLPTAFRERCQTYIPCEVVGTAAWDEVVLEGDQIDLTKLPIPLQFPVDAAPTSPPARSPRAIR